jgi:hypothetical protein
MLCMPVFVRTHAHLISVLVDWLVASVHHWLLSWCEYVTAMDIMYWTASFISRKSWSIHSHACFIADTSRSVHADLQRLRPALWCCVPVLSREQVLYSLPSSMRSACGPAHARGR